MKKKKKALYFSKKQVKLHSKMSVRAVLLVLPFLLSQCDDYEDLDYGSAYMEGEYRISNIFTLKYKIAEEMEFQSTESPNQSAVFHAREIVCSANSLYPYNILSPDKKWILLKTGRAEGFVFCKTENLLECIREDCFEGKFNLDFSYNNEGGDRLFVDFIRWEAPATVVFYEVNRDEDRPPHRKTEVFKINLETGIFTPPEQPNPVIKPVLIKERALRNARHKTR